MADQTPDALFEGTLEITLLDEPAPQGWRPILGSSQILIDQKSSQIDVQTTDRGGFQAVVASVTKPNPADLKVKLARTTGVSLAMSLMGDETGYTQSAGTMTAVEIVAIVGQGVDLPKGYVSGLTVKSKVVAPAVPVTYVEGVDYSVNPRFGTITALPGGQITTGETLVVDGAAAAVQGRIIQGGTRTQWNVAMRLDLLNKFDDKDAALIIPKAILTSDGGIDFKSEKPIEPSFTGRFIYTAGQPPYYFRHGLEAVT